MKQTALATITAISLIGINACTRKQPPLTQTSTSDVITSQTQATQQNQAALTLPTQSASPNPPPAQNCFTFSYHHQTIASHSKEEDCAKHGNLIKLKHSNINPTSICIRVNGTPVRFSQIKNKSDEVMIGALAGPHARITARYCIGKSTCTEDCTIPRDEFMDAIGAASDEDDEIDSLTKVGQWDPGNAAEQETAALAEKLASELKGELAEEVRNVFQGWTSTEAEDPSKLCGKKQALARRSAGAN